MNVAEAVRYYLFFLHSLNRVEGVGRLSRRINAATLIH